MNTVILPECGWFDGGTANLLKLPRTIEFVLHKAAATYYDGLRWRLFRLHAYYVSTARLCQAGKASPADGECKGHPGLGKTFTD